MSKVQKHCSVLNYIRHADEELYDIIQDLCIGRMFVPKRGTPGITFLRPDKSLLKEIKDMASGNNPEEAVEALQALVLLDNISSIKEFDEKRKDIPTYLRQKLPILSVDGNSVKLQGGAVITPDDDFEARGDRANISVYIISKALVPPKTEESDFSNAKIKKVKKGGADLGDSRRTLFEAVLSKTCANREPAMEMLVQLHRFLKNDSNKQSLVASLCSFDALASLAIVLQPYKDSPNYLSDADVSQFLDSLYGKNDVYRKNPDYFGLVKDVADAYNQIVSQTHPAASRISSELSSLSSRVGKLNVVQKIKMFYDDVKIDELPAERMALSKKEKFAEAELRVLSAIMFDNESSPDVEVMKDLYAVKCKLNTPYMCDDPEFVRSSNIGFYFSTVYLIARSDALMYVPGVASDGVGLDQIFNEDKLVCINDSMRKSRAAARDGSNNMVNGYIEAVMAQLNAA